MQVVLCLRTTWQGFIRTSSARGSIVNCVYGVWVECFHKLSWSIRRIHGGARCFHEFIAAIIGIRWRGAEPETRREGVAPPRARRQHRWLRNGLHSWCFVLFLATSSSCILDATASYPITPSLYTKFRCYVFHLLVVFLTTEIWIVPFEFPSGIYTFYSGIQLP